MPCYITYKCFGYIKDEELEKFLDIAREKGFTWVDRQEGIIRVGTSFGNEDFTLEREAAQWSVQSLSTNRRLTQNLDNIKAGMNRDKFVQKWRQRNPGWNVQQVRS